MRVSIGQRKAWVFRFTKMVARPLLSLFFILKTEGLENLPADSAYILLPKHQRWEDIPLIGLATPGIIHYIAKYELFLNPILGWYLAAMGGLPLNRKRPLESRRTLKTMLELLKKGEGIVIFPEGTYYKGRMGRGHVGLVRMLHSRIPLPFIPVGIRYARRGFRTSVRIKFGRPIPGEPRGNAEDLFRKIMVDIAQLSEISYKNSNR